MHNSLETIAIGLIGVTATGLVASGLVKWPSSIIMLTILYVVIVLHGFYTLKS
jgi:hypothetical protein